MVQYYGHKGKWLKIGIKRVKRLDQRALYDSMVVKRGKEQMKERRDS